MSGPGFYQVLVEIARKFYAVSQTVELTALRDPTEIVVKF